MANVLEIIDSVHPSDGSTGVPLNNTIQVIFDREIDEWSLEHGGLILEGPDSDQVIYPGYAATDLTNGGDILQSPQLKGVIPGTFTFGRVDLTTNTIVHTADTTGAGNLYRTKVTFKPEVPLKPQTNYTVYLIGDDDNEVNEEFAIRTKSVFDYIADVGNTGSGTITVSGTYTGAQSHDTYNVRITKSGVIGEAEFEAWRDSAPLDLQGPFETSVNESSLFNGVTIRFIDGSFALNDEFSVYVKKPTFIEETATFSFSTGNGSISVVPTNTATSPTGDPLPLAGSTEFKVVSTSPVDEASNLDIASTKRITIQFSSDIDPATISDDTVEVLVEPVIDHPLLSTQVAAGPIFHTLTVSGSKLFIDL
jgi:hypothetical protein